MKINKGNMDANMDENTVISAQNLIVSYGSRTIVKDVSFTIKSGEFVGLLGANGAGKTTLFRAIMGLIPHTGKLEVRAPHME
ncbi:MAG: ABC transporter ATP-binding protein, partial [Gardnerella vaginalis]